MKISRKIAQWISDYLALIVLCVAILALSAPQAFAWMPSSSISWLLGLVMFGMGLTLKPVDFKMSIVRPLPVIIGCCAQFVIMPGAAWFLCKAFSLPPEIAIGVILVGCCPGGTASNIITYLAKGDMALSICMTGFSTILAPFLTPFLTWLLAGATVDVNVWDMMLSVTEVVIVPIAVGLIVKICFDTAVSRIIVYLPAFSTVAVGFIIGIVLALNAQSVLSSGWLILVVVMLHNLFGFVFGYGIGTLAGMSQRQRNAVTIEVGMQNSGLATSLAATNFAMYPMAAVPGAIFSVWHNFSGALAASILKRQVKGYSTIGKRATSLCQLRLAAKSTTASAMTKHSAPNAASAKDAAESGCRCLVCYIRHRHHCIKYRHC